VAQWVYSYLKRKFDEHTITEEDLLWRGLVIWYGDHTVTEETCYGGDL